MTDPNDEIELDGQLVLNWMKVVGIQAARNGMVGCSIDNGTSENLFRIEDVTEGFTLVCNSEGKTVNIPAGLLRKSTILDTPPHYPLSVALNSIKTDAQVTLERVQAELKSRQFPVTKLTRASDAFEALSMMVEFEQSHLPSESEQNARFEIIKRSGLTAMGAKIIRQWLDLKLQSDDPFDGSILIKLAYCLRHSGEHDKALLATETVIKTQSRIFLTPRQTAVLATIRAAVLLDLFELRNDVNLLKEARSFAGRAWAISQSEETRRVYHRLKLLER